MPSFLRWAGSKRKLIPLLSTFWSTDFDRYVEPFVGSAALFFAIQPKRAVLGDVNRYLCTTYRAVRTHPEQVYDTYTSMPPKNKEFYLSLRKKAFESDDETEIAANFMYLNRNCFNGLFRTNKSGVFNVPFTNARNGSIPPKADFLAVSEALNSAEICHSDFEQLIRKHVRAHDFVYLDPPYAVKNERIFRQYGPETFGLNDLQRLETCLEIIHDRGASFLMSYALCVDVERIAARWRTIRTETQRNIAGFAAHRRLSPELLVTNL